MFVLIQFGLQQRRNVVLETGEISLQREGEVLIGLRDGSGDAKFHRLTGKQDSGAHRRKGERQVRGKNEKGCKREEHTGWTHSAPGGFSLLRYPVNFSMATRRLYLDDDNCCETAARLVAVRLVAVGERALAFDQTCFYPGGGGQPADQGSITFADGRIEPVHTVEADAEGVIWHLVSGAPGEESPGDAVTLAVDRERRLAYTRYHTVLHVLNTIALRDYGAWITGAQIAEDYSRIDFKWDGFSPALPAELTAKVQAVLEEKRRIRSYYLTETEFEARPELRRTLEVRPPVVDGRVRVVEIDGFDAQACGGTHAHSTADVGLFSIWKTENKGKINKRLYVRLEAAHETPHK